MIRLDRGLTTPFAVDVGLGVVVTCRPMDAGALALAEARARRRLAAEREEDDEDLPDEEEDARDARFQVLYGEELGAILVDAWEGVGNAEGTADARCTPDAVRALLREWPWCETFTRRLRARQAALVAAKKGCGPSPDGTSAAGPGSANGAATSGLPAPAASPGPTATVAPTTSTRPARSRKRPSGTPS